MVIVTEDEIDPSRLFELVGTRHSGSAVFHYAVVKAQTARGRVTTHIDYQAHGDVVAELLMLATSLKDRWHLEDVLLVRRIGRVRVGEIISVVAATSPNSADAFEASRHATSLLKRLATLHKKETYRILHVVRGRSRNEAGE